MLVAQPVGVEPPRGSRRLAIMQHNQVLMIIIDNKHSLDSNAHTCKSTNVLAQCTQHRSGAHGVIVHVSKYRCADALCPRPRPRAAAAAPSPRDAIVWLYQPANASLMAVPSIVPCSHAPEPAWQCAWQFDRKPPAKRLHGRPVVSLHLAIERAAPVLTCSDLEFHMHDTGCKQTETRLVYDVPCWGGRPTSVSTILSP